MKQTPGIWTALILCISEICGCAAAAQPLPTRMLECEARQCSPGGPGAAVWTFDGRQGQARWPIAGGTGQITIESFTAGRVLIRLGVALATGASQPHSIPASASWRGDFPGTVLREARSPDGTITMIRFDYPSGVASRTVVAAKGGKVLSNERLSGRPQSSRAEFQQAVRLISRDSRLTGLLARGAVAEGGFIVDGPRGSPERHRYVQIRLLSPDRRDLLKVALVDLTAGSVASARDSFE